MAKFVVEKIWVTLKGGGSHMRPRTNFVLALHGECLHPNTYKNAFICFVKRFLGLRIAP